MNVRNKLVTQGPAVSLNMTNNILVGYLKGLGYRVLSKTDRPVLQNSIVRYMEVKNLWNLGEDKEKFFTKRSTRKRKKSQGKQEVQRKSRKLSDDKKSESLNHDQKAASVKAKQKVPNKKHPVKKNKSKQEQKEEKLPKQYLLPDELIFDKFIFERKGYRIIPIERDGNCLFGAVADQVFCDPNLHAHVRKLCADYMEEEEKYFSEFNIEQILSVDYPTYIDNLRKDGAWGGDPEIVAISHIYKRAIEVYEESEKPKMFELPNDQGNNGPPIRLFYRNNHYASIRSDGVGDLFNFQDLEPGELEQQMVKLNDPSIITKSKDFHKRIESVKNFSKLDSDMRQAIEYSIALEETEKAYLRYYASKLK